MTLEDMTVDEMIRFKTDKCITHIQREMETKILDGVYTVSQKNDLGFNEEEIKKMLLMFKPMQKELEVYKKAFELSCKTLNQLCESAECFNCSIKSQCRKMCSNDNEWQGYFINEVKKNG